jgi:hypothetical protein
VALRFPPQSKMRPAVPEATGQKRAAGFILATISMVSKKQQPPRHLFLASERFLRFFERFSQLLRNAYGKHD